jgi:hypothetical protein
MPIHKTIPVLTVFILLTACSKKSGGNNDTTPPVITIVSPLNNEHFNAGETIQTTATATDNDRVTELHIHVSNATTGVLLRDIHSFPGQPSGTVQDSFTAAAGINYAIKIIAYDAAHNLATAEVDVSAN